MGSAGLQPRAASTSSDDLLAWLDSTGCCRLAVHFDVDTIDSDEIVLGLGAEPGGLTGAQVRRIVNDLDEAGDVVGITIAEFIPRQGMHLQRILERLSLVGVVDVAPPAGPSSGGSARGPGDHDVGGSRGAERPVGNEQQ